MSASQTSDQPPNSKSLTDWLAWCEHLHPSAIELGLDRVRAVVERLQLDFSCPVITVAGTNGKGSTCAMIEAVLVEAAYRVGTYTSPHLLRFEERCRLNGAATDAATLLPAFEAVERARGDVALTYFEFTTLAILKVFADAELDAVVLEVGLGGRLDAVNVIDTDCAVITSIDLDHIGLLGNTREKIGFEKAGIMRAGKPVIVGDPVPPQSVLDHAEQIGADVWRLGSDYNYQGNNPQQWSWAGRGRRYTGLPYPALRGANQLINASGALAALHALRQRLPVTAQAVRNGLVHMDLPGRFQVVPGSPPLILDVGHNPHAVAALTQSLASMGNFLMTYGIYGAMADKDVAEVLRQMDGCVDRWYFVDLPVERAATGAQLHAIWRDVTERKGTAAEVHASPQIAFDAVAKRVQPTDRIVCFGSFYTVAGLLENGVPHLTSDAPWQHT